MGSIDMDYISNLVEKSFYDVNSGQVYTKAIDEIQKVVIVKALEYSHGNQLRTAKILGIHRNTLRTKINKFGISLDKWR